MQHFLQGVMGPSGGRIHVHLGAENQVFISVENLAPRPPFKAFCFQVSGVDW